MKTHRREFLLRAGATAAGLSLIADVGHTPAQNVSGPGSVTVSVPELVNGSIEITGSVTLPPTDQSGIEHVIVVMMENRSFDHFLGCLPNADGKQDGLTYIDADGVPHSTYELAPDYEGCGFKDPDHSYTGSRIAYDGGNMDGFLKDTSN